MKPETNPFHTPGNVQAIRAEADKRLGAYLASLPEGTIVLGSHVSPLRGNDRVQLHIQERVDTDVPCIRVIASNDIDGTIRRRIEPSHTPCNAGWVEEIQWQALPEHMAEAVRMTLIMDPSALVVLLREYLLKLDPRLVSSADENGEPLL